LRVPRGTKSTARGTSKVPALFVLLWDDYRSKSGNVLRGRRGKLGQEGLLVLNVVKHVDARVFEGCLTTFKDFARVCGDKGQTFRGNHYFRGVCI